MIRLLPLSHTSGSVTPILLSGELLENPLLMTEPLSGGVMQKLRLGVLYISHCFLKES